MGKVRTAIRVLGFVIGIAALTGVLQAEDDLTVEERVKTALQEDAKTGLSLLEDLFDEVHGADPAQPRDVERVRQAMAQTLMRLGNPYGALEHWEALTRASLNPTYRVQYAEALVAVARINQAKGSTAAGSLPYLIDAEKALENIETYAAVRDDATWWARAVLAQSSALYFQMKFEDVVAYLDDALLAGLSDAYRLGAYDILALAHYARKAYGDAAKAYEAVGNARGAAAAWAAAKDGDRAAKLYVDLLKNAPTDLGLLREALNGVRYAGGQAVLEKALAEMKAPEEAQGERLLARCQLLADLGREEESIPLLKEAALKLLDARPLTRLGRLILVRSQADEQGRADATDVYLEAVRRAPEDRQAIAGLWHIAGLDYRDLWMTRGRGPGAERTVRIQEALVAAMPGDGTASANLGNTLRVVGRTADALVAYETAMEAEPYDPTIVSDYGLALSAAGRFEDALVAYERSVALDSGHLAGRQNAARALWLKGDDKRATEHLAAGIRTARALEKGAMTYRFLLDRAWRAAGSVTPR